MSVCNRPVSRFLVCAGAVLSLVVSGCGRQEPSPRDIQPGSVDEVATQSEGGTLNGNREPILEMGITPLSGWRKKSIPVVKGARAITAWFFPMKSPDGLTIRHGFYADHIVQTASWGMWDAMHEDAINLNSLAGMRVNDNGQLVITPTGVPGAGQGIPEFRGPRISVNDPKALPWTPTASTGDESVTRRAIVVDEASGNVMTYSDTAPDARSFSSDDGKVDMDAVREMIRTAHGRVSNMNQAPTATMDGGQVRIDLGER